MNDIYAYDVQIEEIRPLPTGQRFAAKVPYVVKSPGKTFERLYPHLGEVWGMTREEAEQKARAAADKWIAEQLGE